MWRGLLTWLATMAEWREVRLGDLFAPCNLRLGSREDEPPVLSITKHQGFVPADRYFTKRIASKKLDQYKVVDQEQWAFSTIHIDEGSIARNTLGYLGVVSPMYTTMRWIGLDDEPAYFELLLRSPLMLTAYRDRAQGSVNRRRSIPYSAFASMSVRAPSPAHQRRVVDLIGALDARSAAIVAEHQRGSVMLGRLLDDVWDGPSEYWTMAVGKIADLASGPSWAASDEANFPAANATPVLKITNTRADGRLDLSERLYVRGLPKSTRLLDHRSLIAIRTNGNRERIGNVYLPTADVLGSAVSAFQFVIQADSPEVRDYLYWVLRAPHSQRLMSDAASGSTGLGNLATKWLRALEIPWGADAARRHFVDNASAAGALIAALALEVEAVRVVRATLLSSLLLGEIEIPESYDAMLARAV
jgi:type I restriction enzyme, S subunit